MSHRHSFALALVLAGTTLTASAGLRVTSPVWIDHQERIVMGAFGDTRATADNVQYISCVTGAFGIGSCAAVDATGRMGACSTNKPDQLATIRSLTQHSFIVFSWDKGGTCTSIQVQNSSYSNPAAISGD